jgi:hypothetical protein
MDKVSICNAYIVIKFVMKRKQIIFFRLIEGEFIPSEEFPEGGPAAIRDLETPPFLRIQDEEPETW